MLIMLRTNTKERRRVLVLKWRRRSVQQRGNSGGGRLRRGVEEPPHWRLPRGSNGPKRSPAPLCRGGRSRARVLLRGGHGSPRCGMGSSVVTAATTTAVIVSEWPPGSPRRSTATGHDRKGRQAMRHGGCNGGGRSRAVAASSSRFQSLGWLLLPHGGRWL